MTGKAKTERSRSYVSTVHRTARGYRISFPDLPGCVAEGGNVDEAMRNARTALRGHLAELRKAKAEIPPPRAFHQVILSADGKGAIAYILI